MSTPSFTLWPGGKGEVCNKSPFTGVVAFWDYSESVDLEFRQDMLERLWEWAEHAAEGEFLL